MAAAGAVRAARRARRSFDIFVADVPWTVSSSECAPQRLPSLPVGRGGGLGLRGSRGDWGRVITALFPPAEELKEYFAQFGAVQRCQLPFDKDTGFHKRFCWIKFSSPEDVQNTLQKDSHILEGSKLSVKPQQSRRFNQQKEDNE
uniref:SRA stem-loop interacting RNA binding protein n=1 Tax=Anas platyrhynchos TaxID=8839 RepID=A0A8B9SQ10_ANAPL